MNKLLWVFVMVLGVNSFAQKAILSNFRIENSNKDRVYFDVDGDISGLTKQGFVINGKIISSISTSGSYFRVSTPFTFWDNNTIRLGENSDTTDSQSVLHNFTLTYIKNNIEEPKTTINRYVTITASGGGDGRSESSAWTLKEAFAKASSGMTVWMKAGNYGNQNLSISIDGTSATPIKFIGYKITIGDITSNYYDYGVTWSTSEMPTLTGVNASDGHAIQLMGVNYVVFRNLQITNYYQGIRANNTLNSNLVFDKINGKLFGRNSTGYNDVNATFMNFATYISSGSGSYRPFTSNNYIKLLNCRSVNANMGGFTLFGSGNNIVDGCKSYNDRTGMNERQDYHISINGHNNIIRNCYAENFNTTSTNAATHGIGIRGSSNLDNDFNLIEQSKGINLNESFYIRNYGCDNNVIKDCYAGNNANAYNHKLKEHSGAVYLWGGVSNNIIERVVSNEVSIAIGFIDNNEEGNTNDKSIGYNNIIRNCVFNGHRYGIYVNGYTGSALHNNKILNTTFNDGTFLFRDVSPNADIKNLEIINSNFSNFSQKANYFPLNGLNFSNSNFYNFKSEWIPQGSNNISVDPKFVNVNSRDFSLQPNSKLIDIGVELYDSKYDIINNYRLNDDSPDIGAYEYTSNTTGSIDANAGSDESICQGESITLTASGGSAYSWNTGASTKSITVSPNMTTTYTVTVSNSGVSDTDSVQVTVNTVTADAGSNKTINEGEQVTLTANGGDTYLWNTGATTRSISVSPSTTTTYSVSVTNNGCEDTDEVTVTVNQNNNAVNANAGSDESICQGESVTLTASGGSAYSWNTGASTKSITVSPNMTTTYTVTVSDSGVSDTDSVQVTVNTVTADAGSNKTINEGEQVTLTASGGDTYLWNTGDKSKSITVSPQESLVFSVTVYKNGCSDSDSVQVTVIQNDTSPPPAKADAGEDQTICLGESIKLTASGGATYLWSTGETSKFINVNPTRTTTYSVEATRGGVTNSDVVVVTVENCSALSEGSKQDGFNVYPNPTNGRINIKVNNNDSLNLNIYSITGSIVYSNEVQTNNNIALKTVDLSNLTKGIYIVRIFNANYNKSKKILLY